MTKKLTVVLFDGDGCIFNPEALDLKNREAEKRVEWTQTQVALGNSSLFDANLLHLAAVRGSVVIMSGSNRQSYSIDFQNGTQSKTGSFLPILAHLRDFLSSYLPKVELDKFLLADIFCDLPVGTSYDLAVNHQGDKQCMHPNCPLEETKTLLMYTVLNYIAEKYTEEEYEIECIFYDDRKMILDGLHAWLNNNPDILPRHIKLKLNRYDGELQYQYEPLVGTGSYDPEYRLTAKMLLSTVGVSPYINWFGMSNVFCHINPSVITLQLINSLKSRWSEICHDYQLKEEEDTKACEGMTDEEKSRSIRFKNTHCKKLERVISSDDDDSPVNREKSVVLTANQSFFPIDRLSLHRVGSKVDDELIATSESSFPSI